MDSDDDQDIDYTDEESADDQENIYKEAQGYMSGVVDFLISHECVSTENALEINQYMQKLLLQIKVKLEAMLKKCREKYLANARLLTSDNFNSRSRKRNLMNTYTYCGAPFFKDHEGYSHPHNKDYIYRKAILRELFPIDIKSLSVAIWTVKDKIGVIQGIKTQVIEYFETKQVLPNKGNIKKSPSRNKVLDKNIAVHSQRLVDLLSQVGDDFKINWYKISIILGSRHPENCCEAMWAMYLRPDLSRENWTHEENQKLLAAVQEHNFQDWEAIARQMGNRSSYQCFVQFRTEQSSFSGQTDKERKRWTEEQDELLKEAVDANKVGDVIMWTKVASHFPHKTKTQIYTRYKYSIDPNLKKGNFTDEEDCIILAAVQEYGENFYLMPRSLFPGRTISQIRTHYYNVLKQTKSHKVWNVEDDKKLVELVKQHGSNWSLVAKHIESHTRISCRTRYLVIKKYLENDPNNTIENIPRKRRGVQTQVNMDNWVEKIIEIREHEGKEKETPLKRAKPIKLTYRDALRSIERDYYEFLKYSYDFKFDLDRRSLFPHMKPFQCLKYLLSVQLTAKALKANKRAFNMIERDIITGILKSNPLPYLRGASVAESDFGKEFHIPPSWCTILGLRGVCIRATSDVLEEKPIGSCEQDQDDIVEKAKMLFKKRFFALFYKTALLGDLSPTIREKLTGDRYTIEPYCKKRKLDST